MLGFALNFKFVQVCNLDKNEYTKKVNHSCVCPNYMQCNMYTSVQITTIEEKIRYIGMKIDTCLDANV